MDKSYFAERGYLMAQIRFPVIDPVATGANISGGRAGIDRLRSSAVFRL